MQSRLIDVPVEGGDLRLLVWGSGKHVAVGLHGITASAMSWQAVARHMPTGWTLAAPDLRGRGHSRDLPGPYGLDRHVADVTAVLRHFGGRPVLAGHSMGAYAALLTRDAHPSLIRRLVLVDGGLPRPVPDGVDPEASLEATFGPALTRLNGTPKATPTTGVLSLLFATPASNRIQGRSRLRSVKRQTTSEVDCSMDINRLYHSSPKSMPSVPFLSDDRNVLIIPALTLLSSLPKASASSASRASWLMKTRGPLADTRTSASGADFVLSVSVIVFPPT